MPQGMPSPAAGMPQGLPGLPPGAQGMQGYPVMPTPNTLTSSGKSLNFLCYDVLDWNLPIF